MPKLLICLTLIILNHGVSAQDNCENSFANKNETIDPVIQKKLVSDDQAVKKLIDEYGKRLGPFRDPFELALSPEQGERVFKRLSRRIINDKEQDSPLAIINAALKFSYLEKPHYDGQLVQWLIDEMSRDVKQQDSSQFNLQSNLLALNYASEYLRRYRQPEVVVDRDGKKQEIKKPDQQKPKKDQELEQDQPPEYPELPKEYKPFTKDTQSGKGKQKKHRVAEVNFKTAFFGQRYFSEIVRGAPLPFRESILPSLPDAPGKYQDTGKELVVRTFGKRIVDLFVPPSFKPLQPSDPRATISRSETGGYILQLTDDLGDVRIPLSEDDSIVLLPHLRELYTRPVGFKAEEWPDMIQADILRKYSAEDGKDKPLKVAQAIADHLADKQGKNYLYSVGSRPETDPVDALKAGAFQCDMAAFAMVGLLRDVYQIPSRVVGGYRGKKFQDGNDQKSYLVIPGEAHAWVEVFHDRKWHLFDPTPVKKDKKDSDTQADEYSDQVLDNTPLPDSDNQSNNESDRGQSKDQQQTSQDQDHKKRLDQDTKKRTDTVETKKPDEQNHANEGKDKKDDKNQDQDDQLTKDDLANQLELGSLELEPQLDRNILLERAVRVLLQIALDPTQSGLDIQNRLNQLSMMMRRFHSPELKALYQKALSAHSYDHPGLKEWIDQLVRMIPTQDVNKTYQELHKIILALETYAKVLDHNGKIQPPQQLVEILEKAQTIVGGLAHHDSQDIGLVQDLVKDLPAVVRVLLKQQFDLSQVGPNNPTLEIAKQLKAGQLNDLRLLAILSPLADFILNSTPRPENIEIKTWTKDSARPRGRDLLPLQRFSDLARVLWGQPGKSIEDNIREGTAYVANRRQRIRIPVGYGKEEAERITVVLYDTSGSMAGDPGRFQAGLISAFTAKALSDVAPSGRHRHRVVIVPFDDEPKDPVPVTNTQEALDVIRDYQQKLANTDGGTNIQKALLQAMSLIADAERRSGEPLAAANIILMTDGQAKIDSEELLQARKAIDRQTPLQTMFIAINQTNEELMKFAMGSQAMGAERGFYREFTAEHITDILHEADHLELKNRGDFYTDKPAKDIPPEVYELLDQALRLSLEYSDQIYYGSQYLSAREHLENLEKVKWLDVKEIDRPLEKWLIKVQQLARHPVFKDKRILERVVDDLVTHIEMLTSVQLNSMSDHEQERLRHLVRYAAGLEEFNAEGIIK